MKLNKIMLATAVVFSLSTVAVHAKDMGHGKITFKGSIIDAPCSIDPESESPVVRLGQIANAVLAKGGQSIEQDFSIKLTQCDNATIKTVSTKFSGTPDAVKADNLALSGTAKGASIALKDKASGKAIKLNGDYSDIGYQNLTDTGTTELNFSAYLQGNGASIVPGDFESVATFTLDYK